ncbi:MAG: M56 family metallopeptidase [Gemmatimonadota bacterium]
MMMTILDPVSIFRVVLLSTLVTGAVVVSAALFQRAFSGAAASIRHAVWMATLVIALILPLAAAVVPLQWGARIAGLEQTVRLNRGVEASLPAEVAALESGPPVITIERSAAENGAGVFLLIWLLGIGGVVLHLGNSARRLRAVLASARPLNERVLADCLPAHCEEVTIRQTGRIELPLTAGIMRPLILLPEGAVDSWSNRRMRAALLHEFAHIRRRDVAWQILGRIACALHWFNPFVWYAARQCARAAEQSCDDAVLDAGVRPSSYAGHLLEIARWAAQQNTFALAVGQGSELEGRITAVLSPVRARRGLSRRALQRIAWAAALVAVGLGTHRTLRPSDAQAEATESRATRRSEQAVDDALVRLLDDIDPAVRAAAARSAGELQIQSAIEPLLRALQDRHPQVRVRAAHSLGELENGAGITGLHQALLTDPDVNVRREAASALGEIESDAAAAALKDALGRVQSANMRRQIIRALGETRSSTALPVLKALIDGHDEQTRRTALEALTQLQSPEATRLLLQATNSQNPETRRVAARAIADAHR